MKKFMGKDNIGLLILGAIFIFVAVFVIFYPPIYTTQDEANYFGFAYRLKVKTIYFDPLYAHKVVFNGERYVDMYPPGMPLLLVPFTLVHWKALFLLNLLLHLGAFFAFYSLLKLLNIKQRLSLLYLFFPAFTLYTRTLTADMATASLLMIALYFYFRRDLRSLILSGMLFGIICVIKYTNFIVAVLLMLFLFLKEKKKIRYILAGFLPFIFLILMYNYIAYGGVFKTGYSYVSTSGAFGFRYLFNNLFFYVSSLMVIYPLMFLSIFLYKKALRNVVVFIPLSMIALFGFWHYVQVYPGQNPFGRLIVGMRLLLPVVPLFIIGYAHLLDRIFKRAKNYYPLIINLLAACLIISTLVISFKHQQYLDRLVGYKQKIYNNIPEDSLTVCDGEIPKFLQDAWGKRKRINLHTPELDVLIKRNDDVYVAALIRFDKQAEAEDTLQAIRNIDRRYKLKPIYDKEEYFNLKIYKLK